MNQPAKKPNNRPLKPVPTAEGEAKPKRERKPRAPRGSGGGWLGEIRASATKQRTSMAKLVDAEQKLEAKLATVRREREAAEGPLNEIEAILARYPELPLEQPSEPQPAQPAYADEVPAELQGGAT